MDNETLAILMSGLVVLIPVAGLTLRFALKPMVDSIARLLEVRNGAASGAASVELVDKRVQLLEQELHAVRAEMQSLTDRTDFYERLASPRQAT